MSFSSSRDDRRFILAPALLLGLAACAAPSGSDADDVTRLAVLNVSAALQLINDDSGCGFESPGVIASQEFDGEFGSEGKVTRRVNDCLVDLSINVDSWPSSKCDTSAGRATGRFRFSGSRTMSGRLTNAPATPVIPSGVEPLTIEIERLEFEEFDVRREDKAGFVTLVDGSMSGKAQIVLAASKSDGFCRVPTPNALLSDLKFEGATARFTNILKTRDYEIGGSRLEAVSGTVDGRTNVLSGEIQLDGVTMDVPVASTDGQKPFDVQYDKETFEAAYACNDSDLELPVTTSCDGIDQIVSENAARLGGVALTTAIGLLSADKTCGFASPVVMAAGRITGTPGESGSITYTVSQCRIALGKGTQTAPDCAGQSDMVSGEVTLSGTRTIKGLLTGDVNNPVVPESDAGVDFELTSGALLDFGMQIGERYIEVQKGNLSGKMQARIARSTEFGVCSVPTKIASISDVNLKDAIIHLSTGTGAIDATVSESALFGVNGAWKNKENALWGSVVTGGQKIVIAEADPVPFDTAYRREVFDASWQCAPTLAKPVSYECSSELPLPENAARLSVVALGALSNLIENDATCGFANTQVRQNAQMTRPLGEVGTGTFSVTGCTKTFPTETVISTDCNGKKLSVQGSVTFRVTKTMNGYNTGSLTTPVLPTSRDAVQFDVTADLSNFTFTLPASGSVNRLIVSSGTLSGKVAGRLALDATTHVCSKSTPVSTFQNVSLRSTAPVMLEFDGNRFSTQVADMNLSAQNGTKDAVTNLIAGSLTVGGERHTFPIAGSSALDPDFTPAVFDASYQRCDTNLVVPADDAACQYTEELALNAARGLVLALNASANTLNADADCGLNLAAAERDPAQVTGRRGSIGSATWTAPPRGGGTCRYDFAPTRLQDRDCLGTETFLGGSLPMSATLLVRGRIEDQNGTAYVNPTSPDAPTDYNFTMNGFQNLRAARVNRDGSKVLSIEAPTGSMTARFNPILGRSTDNNFTYLARTPVLRILSLTLGGATPVVLGIQDMTLKTTLSNVAVTGFSGTYNGTSNKVGGTLAVDGRTVMLDGPLDAQFTQQRFDAGYECRDGGVVPTQFP